MKRVPWRRSLLAVLPLLTAAAAACERPSPPRDPARDAKTDSAPVVAAAPIRIGAVLPLTGEVSFLGEGDRNALRLYAKQHPGVEFIFEDSKGTPREGLTAVQRLSSSGVKYYITSLSYVVNTVQPVLDRQQALNFTLNMDPRTEEQSPFALRLYVTFYDEMDRLVELAAASGARRVGVLYVNVETMNNAVENYLRPKLQARGIALRTETYELGTRDFRQQLLRLAGTSGQRPDVVRILDFGDKLAVILQQIDEGRVFPQARLVSGIETLVAPYAQFPAAIQQRFVFTAPELLLSPSNPTVQAYTREYGAPPNFDAMFAYDIANLLVPAIRARGYDNVQQVIQDIVARKQFRGVAAEYTINQHGGVSPRISWARIANGAVVFTGDAPPVGAGGAPPRPAPRPAGAGTGP